MVHDGKYRELEDKELLKAFDAKYPLKPEITEERLTQIHDVVRRIHGRQAADKCLEAVKRRGYINFALRYFALHYSADQMPLRNMEFIKAIEDAGFGFFKPYRLKED